MTEPHSKYEVSDHVIFHGDAFDILPRFSSSSVDLVFVDPPYNIGKRFGDFHDKWASDEEYAAWAYRWLEECIRILKPTWQPLT